MNQTPFIAKPEGVGAGLAAYATHASKTRGRLFPEAPSSSRTEFQRDRDRIIHAGAFRKMRNKTQVFIENEGDYYRTRLTHSLEVAQIARSASRALGLNEDLAEAIALSHDLGHTCFGHAGEYALDEVMQPYGGFDHNDQTFRILTQLENNYAAFDGLNLTWETLEGIAKHNGPLLPETEGHALPATLAAFNTKWDLELESFAGPEAQVAAIADDIAYNTHDLDDGYRAGFISFDDVRGLPLFGPSLEQVLKRFPHTDQHRAVREAVRDVVGLLIDDLLATTRGNLIALGPQSVEAIRRASAPVATLSPAMKAHETELRTFLRTHMYKHSEVNRVCAKSARIVKEMFAFLMENPNCLPHDRFAALNESNASEPQKARVIADFIAGMTDPFAVREHRRLFSTETMI